MSALIAVRLPRTLLLGAINIAFELALGILAGTIAALRHQGRAPSRWCWARPSWASPRRPSSRASSSSSSWPINGAGFPILAVMADTALGHVWHGILPAVTIGLLGTAWAGEAGAR